MVLRNKKQQKSRIFELSQSRKGQVQMTETIAVLFIFFILIVFGISFFYQYAQSSFQAEQEELLGKRAIETTLKALFIPELMCTKGDAEAEDNCFDMMKVRHAMDVFNESKLVYFDTFSFSKISLTEIYPGNETYELYDFPKKDWENSEKTFFIIAMKDEVKGDGQPHYGLGRLDIEVYS
ncbi:hypothetical protein HOD05_02210 [Candidatus Woesearchaeota archaeon]|mgnify:CR=1 FL=1|jgi:preprotein translocase subunit SecG|nr:hypothetical protein [Candidatus Woesearchaeota archaeon]